MKKILFICPYPTGLAPSQRFRFEQYIDLLEQKGIKTVTKPFFTKEAHAAFFQSGDTLTKIRSIFLSYLNRFALLLQVHPFDFVFIHREATPLGPPLIEWIISKVIRVKIIYDFDDAIWTTDNTTESRMSKWLRWRGKVRSICKWSHQVSCGNEYLAAFARQANPNVTIIPTTINTFPPQAKGNRKRPDQIVIGWTGSHSTLKYLATILPVLKSIQDKYPYVSVLVIADRNPYLPLKNYRFIQWNLHSEIVDLETIDIGIMPLPDDDWTRGKCGFKALQYMAMSIPAVISPVGVNQEIVTHGIEGYLCTTMEQWLDCLEDLILSSSKRIEMGRRGRQKVLDLYSVDAISPRFLSLFQEASIIPMASKK